MKQESQIWPEWAAALYDRLGQLGPEFTVRFQDANVTIPASTQLKTLQTPWKVNGTIKVSLP